MLGRTHAWSGAAAGLGMGLFSGDVATTLACGALGYVTSYIPDLDHPKATAVRALGPLGWVLCRIIRATSRAMGLPAHRGASHTAMFAALVGVAVGVAASQWVVALSAALVGATAAAGVAAALVGDYLTKQSLPHLWWPLSRATAGPPVALRIRTGSVVEKLIVFPLVLAGCGWLVYIALIP